MTRCRSPRKDGAPVEFLQCCRLDGHGGDCHLHSHILLNPRYGQPHTYGVRTHGGTNLRCTAGAELDGVGA